MRIGFMVAVLLGALLFYRFMDSSAFALNEVTERQVLPMDVSYERTQARSLLNTIREAMQMQTLSPNEE